MARRFQGGILGVGFDPLKAPNAPTIGAATPGTNSVSVAFTAPSNVGGSSITQYTMRIEPGGAGVVGTASPLVATGLSSSIDYTFAVAALNSYGPSPYSASATSSPVPYWIGMLSGAYKNEGRAVGVDSSGNVYVSGIGSTASDNRPLALKLSPKGVMQWQRAFGGAGRAGDGYAAAVTPAGDFYIGGFVSTPQQEYLLVKYSTSGAITWQRYVSGIANSYCWGLNLDPSGNLYTVGQGLRSSSICIYSSAFDSSGTVKWQNTINPSSATGIGYGTAYNASDASSYVCGTATNTGSGVPGSVVAKYNSSGTYQWGKIFPGSGVALRSVVAHSSGDAIVCGENNGLFVARVASANGSVTWQRRFTGGVGRSVALDASGNIYICGSTGLDIFIVKYDSAGVLQWQRSLGGSATDIAYSIAVQGTSLHICGICASTNLNANGNVIVAKLPTDGSGTGTYNVGGYSMTYAATSISEVASTLVIEASYINRDAPPLTIQTPTYTDDATSLTTSTTSI